MPLSAAIIDCLPLQEILGHLNFSSGATDAKFLQNLNALWNALETAQVPPDLQLATATKLLVEQLQSLAGASPTFRDAEQASAAVRLLFDELPAAYRRHHCDLLFHQTDAAMWRPFFTGRAAAAVLTEGGPWGETKRIIDGALGRLNDYLGYRPVAVLENHKHEPYSHERVRPVPLYIAGAGVAVGKYHDLIEQTLAILGDTDADLLRSASFDSAALDELAFDPRAYDFNHPVNRRPNYHFGQWDPHCIDNQGRYRRFVIQQCTLDAVLARINSTPAVPREQLLFEAGAVLAGTMLMASGTSGSGPDTHDSTVSLATLLPLIARYRDEFYERLFAKVPADHRQRLQAERDSRQQPFASARQHLNGELARLRALQMQHVQLALLFARLGFSDAALRQAQIVPAASARMVCQMQCLLTSGHRAADAGRLGDAFAALPQVEDLLRRAIDCGAVIDPWNILAFGGQFSLFPAVENSIPDPRVDELLDLMEQIFVLYSRLWHEAALAGDAPLLKRLPEAFRALAQWWDKFATTAVEGIPHISGAESFVAAGRVADALAAWHHAGEAAGKLAFWRPHAEKFHSPQAYSRVIEVLLEKPDLLAAMALVMHWLGQAEKIGLDSGRRSFFALAVRWMHTALAELKCGKGAIEPALILKFFDYLEANAETYWEIPLWQPAETAGVEDRQQLEETAATGDDDESEDDEDRFSAAYENMVYRDSTADGTDADMLEGPNYAGAGNDELDREHQRLSGRLAFLAMLANLWKQVALARFSAHGSARIEIPDAWLARAAENRRKLQALAVSIQRQPVKASSASYEALLDYDRRRVMREAILERVIATIVGTAEAELFLTATQELDDHSGSTGEAAEIASTATAPNLWIVSPVTIALWQAVLRGDAAGVHRHWNEFIAAAVDQPLLYVPLARGGDPGKIAAARSLQQTFRELLRRLPKLGLLRETCQLLRAARATEKNHPQGPGAVTEFDRLFEIGYKAIVESLVEASQRWTGAPCAPHSPCAVQSVKMVAPEGTVESTSDAQLIDCLQQVTESLLSDWLSHSSTLRISVLERVSTPKAWQDLVKFIERYGHDLFTQQFFHLGNLRAILHQGVDAWLEQLSEDDEAVQQTRLVAELGKKISMGDAKRHLSMVIEAVVENYTEYRDYNATTTQSDRGELLYTFLDFLRVKVGYERIHWNLRPVMMAHEVLVRHCCHGAAELWRRAMAERTSEAADQQLARLAELQNQYAMRLPTIADRLSERFVRPLMIDRVRALVGAAAEEAQHEAPATAFALLEQEAGDLAEEPCGAGLDLPDWLESLDDEVEKVRDRMNGWDPTADDALDELPSRTLSWEEIQSQLTDWEMPPETSK